MKDRWGVAGYSKELADIGHPLDRNSNVQRAYRTFELLRTGYLQELACEAPSFDAQRFQFADQRLSSDQTELSDPALVRQARPKAF